MNQRMKLIKDILDGIKKTATISVTTSMGKSGWVVTNEIHNPSEVADSIELLVKEYEKQQSYTEPAITILDKTNPAPVEVIPTKF